MNDEGTPTNEGASIYWGATGDKERGELSREALVRRHEAETLWESHIAALRLIVAQRAREALDRGQKTDEIFWTVLTIQLSWQADSFTEKIDEIALITDRPDERPGLIAA